MDVVHGKEGWVQGGEEGFSKRARTIRGGEMGSSTRNTV